MKTKTVASAAMPQAAAHPKPQPRPDPDYDAYLEQLQMRVTNAAATGAPIFQTVRKYGDLWAAYLAAFTDPQERQYHNCSACRHFIRRFGGLVTVDEQGGTHSLLWDEAEAPPRYRWAIQNLRVHTEASPIYGPFYTKELIWGTPRTGPWTHLAVNVLTAPATWRHTSVLQTAGQRMAEKREDFRTLQAALDTYPLALVEQALAYLESEQMYRAEKVIGPARFLRDLHIAHRKARAAYRKTNVLWRAVAMAPTGFCHVKSAMIGTLLDDLAAGLGFTEATKRFAAKMHPLRYQRPTEPPKAGNVQRATRIVETLQSAGSFQRRFATLEDIQVKLWTPLPVPPSKSVSKAGGLFASVPTRTPKAPQRNQLVVLDTPPILMTWTKFRRDVLPTAEEMQIQLDRTQTFYTFVTNVDPASPPILQWDRPERRNPVSWYTRAYSSEPREWNVRVGWQPVVAVTLFPQHWENEAAFPHQTPGVLFVIEGCRDTSHHNSAALFPELLKAEYHEIRSTVESFSQNGRLAPIAGQHAAGVGLRGGSGKAESRVFLRVTSGGFVRAYHLDRWE